MLYSVNRIYCPLSFFARIDRIKSFTSLLGAGGYSQLKQGIYLIQLN